METAMIFPNILQLKMIKLFIVGVYGDKEKNLILFLVLKNGAILDYGAEKAKCFDAVCPDECRVHIHGEVIEQ